MGFSFPPSLSPDSAVSEDAKSIRSDLAASSRRRNFTNPSRQLPNSARPRPHGDNGGNQVVVCSPSPGKMRHRRPLCLQAAYAFGTMRSAPARACARHAGMPTGSCDDFSDPQSSLSHAISGAEPGAPPCSGAFKRVPALRAKRGMCIWRQSAPAEDPTFRPAAYRANARSIAEQQIAIRWRAPREPS